MEHVDDQSSDEHKRRRENNEIEHLTMDSESEDEVFLPTNPQPHTVGIIPEEKSKEEEEEEVDPDAPRLRNRRVSYGKIPVPPMPMTVEDIQEAAKQVGSSFNCISQDLKMSFRAEKSKGMNQKKSVN